MRKSQPRITAISFTQLLTSPPQQSYIQMQDPTLDRSFRGHKDVITDLAFKPSMTQIASGSMDNSVMVWHFKPQMRAFRFVGHKGPVTSVDFSPSGNLLASASRDKTVRLWTPNVKGDVTVFKAHTSTVRTVRFSQDGESFLTCSDDKSIKIWSTQRAKFQYTLAGHLNWVRSARFSPDSKMVVSGGDDKSVKLWDLTSKNCVKTYFDHTGMVTSTAFHPAGTIVATASTDRSIKLFDIRTHKLIQHYHDAHVGAGPASDTKGGESAWAGGGPNSVNFGGPGGNWLISTGMDGVVKIWDLKEGHLFYTLHGHKNGPTTAAAFSPEGAFFATGGSDAQLMVWKSNFDAGVPLTADDTGGKYHFLVPINLLKMIISSIQDKSRPRHASSPHRANNAILLLCGTSSNNHCQSNS
ncbi:WD40 repeat-like protein [Rhizoclosmatium globosum]|uniref:WD40 repeat-like protein n=1 Tax=Rhizoclosmatium globosum TaxID=329046 RepID=A0A1Y2BGD0_9FUNG|nr:WD40 repeat-like protein [Rhizoclosmatium globosum]|eukprot:ORY33863.1 WD40 repeat-like protein [Rhizoclosmatium globosum]